MFNAPEYASFIALCRELRLEREFEAGDVIARFDLPFIDSLLVTVLGGHNPDAGSTWRSSPQDVWVPRLDQWLVMLEEAGVFRMVTIAAIADGGWRCYSTEHEGPRKPWSCPTREEACARLWCAVTGRAVTA